MKHKSYKTILWMLGSGLFFGCLMFLFFMFFETAIPQVVSGCLNAPAIGLAWLWHKLGLPPHSEAAFAMPLVFGFVQ
jgi:hypothetical protein